MPMRVIGSNAHACFPLKNGRPYVWPSNGGSARSQKRMGFRENPTNFLTFVARSVCDSVFKTNRRFISELPTNGQTDRQTDRRTRTTTVTLAAHARRGLITVCINISSLVKISLSLTHSSSPSHSPQFQAADVGKLLAVQRLAGHNELRQTC